MAVDTDRGTMAGATIAAVFGIAWSVWAASGLHGTASIVVIAVGVVIGLLILIPTVRARRRAPTATSARSMFSSRPYRIVVAVEIIAMVTGSITLGTTGHTRYIPPLIAFIVGVHFLGFGRLFWRGYYLLGAAMIIAGAAGAVVGLTGHSAGSITATTGVITAVSLLATSARVLRPTR